MCTLDIWNVLDLPYESEERTLIYEHDNIWSLSCVWFWKLMDGTGIFLLASLINHKI